MILINVAPRQIKLHVNYIICVKLIFQFSLSSNVLKKTRFKKNVLNLKGGEQLIFLSVKSLPKFLDLCAKLDMCHAHTQIGPENSFFLF